MTASVWRVPTRVPKGKVTSSSMPLVLTRPDTFVGAVPGRSTSAMLKANAPNLLSRAGIHDLAVRANHVDSRGSASWAAEHDVLDGAGTGTKPPGE
jgi:hypothetical protein